MQIAEKVLTKLKQAYPQGTGLSEPYFIGNELAYVKECIDTRWVSSVGKFVDKFEQKMCEITGAPYAVAITNGTAALHLSLLLAGVEQSDEVITQSLTFVATANAISYLKAIPHFVDLEEESLGIDPYKLDLYLKEISVFKQGRLFNKKTHRPISAMVVMHTYGHPSKLDELLEISKKYNLTLVEDAAESLGSFYKGTHTGRIGKIGAFSFNGNKIATTGGGGAIITNDPVLGKKAKHLSTTAKVPHPWDFVHDEVGYNYRLPNINAALGCAQLESLTIFLDARRNLQEKYKILFSDIEGIQLFQEPKYARSNYWLSTLILEPQFSDQRDLILKMTNESKIMTRPAWRLMHKLEMFKDSPKMDLSCSNSIESRLINIPSSPNMVHKNE